MKIDRKTSFLDLSDNPLSAKAVVGVVAAARKQVNACTHVYNYASIGSMTRTQTQSRFPSLPEMSRMAMSRTHHCRIVNRMLCLAMGVGAEAHQDAQLKKHIRT